MLVAFHGRVGPSPIPRTHIPQMNMEPGTPSAELRFGSDRGVRRAKRMKQPAIRAMGLALWVWLPTASAIVIQDSTAKQRPDPLCQTNMEAATVLEGLVPFTEAFWELPCWFEGVYLFLGFRFWGVVVVVSTKPLKAKLLAGDLRTAQIVLFVIYPRETPRDACVVVLFRTPYLAPSLNWNPSKH